MYLFTYISPHNLRDMPALWVQYAIGYIPMEICHSQCKLIYPQKMNMPLPLQLTKGISIIMSVHDKVVNINVSRNLVGSKS